MYTYFRSQFNGEFAMDLLDPIQRSPYIFTNTNITEHLRCDKQSRESILSRGERKNGNHLPTRFARFFIFPSGNQSFRIVIGFGWILYKKHKAQVVARK